MTVFAIASAAGTFVWIIRRSMFFPVRSILVEEKGEISFKKNEKKKRSQKYLIALSILIPIALLLFVTSR